MATRMSDKRRVDFRNREIQSREMHSFGNSRDVKLPALVSGAMCGPSLNMSTAIAVAHGQIQDEAVLVTMQPGGYFTPAYKGTTTAFGQRYERNLGCASSLHR